MHISNRANAIVEKGKTSVLGAALYKTFANQYSGANEKGVVNLGLAENSLCYAELSTFYSTHLRLLPSDFTYGESFFGSTRLFHSLSNFYATHFHPFAPLVPNGNQIVTTNGVTPLLEQLAAVLCDEGECFIVPRPFYNAFEDDWGRRCNVGIVGVEIPDEELGTLREVEALEREMNRRSMEKGEEKDKIKIRAVVIINPSNPIGFCYDKETLEAYARFAEKWDLYLIVDEIYAMSTFAQNDIPNPTPFTSILSLNVSTYCDPARILQIYGISKDFCANGFRVGVLVVQHNPTLVNTIAAVSGITMKIGSPSDALWSALLDSEEMLEFYLNLNRERLAEAYLFATTWLKERNISYRPSYAGHFVLVDFRKFIEKEGKKGVSLAQEVDLLERLVDSGIYLGPGHSYQAPELGWFRLTFSHPKSTMAIGMDRIERVLGISPA